MSMTKLLGLVFGLLLMISCAGTVPDSDVFASERAARSAMVIEVGDPLIDQWFPIGSGVAVKTDFGQGVLTAAHVAFAVPPEILRYRACSMLEEDECVEIDSWLIDTAGGIENDWAVGRVEKLPKGSKAAKIARDLPDTGEDVVIAGFPQGIPWLSYGNVSLYTNESTGKVMGVDAFARPGSSGCGVWDSRGRLVGLVVAITQYEDAYGLLQLETNQVLAIPVTNVYVL